MTPVPGGRAFRNALPRGVGRLGMRAAFALRIFSGKIIYISRLSRSAERSKRIFTGGVVAGNGRCSAAFCESAALRRTNSLSQSLTALTAPSGREPLAKPRTLHVSREVYRHAKGPIPEGAGTAIAVTGGVFPVNLLQMTTGYDTKM